MQSGDSQFNEELTWSIVDQGAFAGVLGLGVLGFAYLPPLDHMNILAERTFLQGVRDSYIVGLPTAARLLIETVTGLPRFANQAFQAQTTGE